MATTTTHEKINYAPASVNRSYGSTIEYKGLVYKQRAFPSGNSWVLAGQPADGNGIYGGSGNLQPGVTEAEIPNFSKFMFNTPTVDGLLTLDSKTNRVGIGLTAPGYRLHVAGGNAYLEGVLAVGSTTPTLEYGIITAIDDTNGDDARGQRIVLANETARAGSQIAGMEIRSLNTKLAGGTNNYRGWDVNFTGGANTGTYNMIGGRIKMDDFRNLGSATINKYLLELINGTEGLGKVLTSDAAGLANWADAPNTNLAQQLYVSAKGKTVANGAIRESLTNHFLSLDDAVAAALPGDTINVYGDQTTAADLAVEGVKYHFFGNGLITGTSRNLFDSKSGTITEIYVRGDARFRSAYSSGSVLKIEGSTKFDIECYSMEHTNGYSTFYWYGGTDDSRCVVQETINNNFGNYTVKLEVAPKGTLEARLIDCNIITGGIQVPLYIGGTVTTSCTIKADIINNHSQSGANRGQSTVYCPGTITGTEALTIIGNIYANPDTVVKYYQGEGTVVSGGCALKLIGNIYSDTRPTFHTWDHRNPIIELTGNIYTSFTNSILWTSDIADGGVERSIRLDIKGDIISSGCVAPLLSKQVSGSLRFKGAVRNSFLSPSLGGGSVASATVTSGGSGYSASAITQNVTTTGGSGTGLTLHVKCDFSNGVVDAVMIANPGGDYVAGDVVTISGAGDGLATVTIDHVGAAGIVLKDNAGYDAIFDDALLVMDDTRADARGIAAFSGNKDVIITNQVASNKAAANITNLVTGSSLFDDSNIK